MHKILPTIKYCDYLSQQNVTKIFLTLNKKNQIRAALFKEIRGLDYRGLEYAQSDSRICGRFIKLDATRPYSFQMYQSYISKIQETSLTGLMVSLNKIAIQEGLESVRKC